MLLPVGLSLEPLMIHFDVYLTGPTWQVLIEGYLTSVLLLHQLTFGLRWFGYIRILKVSVLEAMPSQLSQEGIRVDHKMFQAQSPLEVLFFTE